MPALTQEFHLAFDSIGHFDFLFSVRLSLLGLLSRFLDNFLFDDFLLDGLLSGLLGRNFLDGFFDDFLFSVLLDFGGLFYRLFGVFHLGSLRFVLSNSLFQFLIAENAVGTASTLEIFHSLSSS